MDQELFLGYAQEYKDTVYRIALNYFRNVYDAQDATQEVLLKLLTCNREFVDSAHVKNWLIRVTVNVCKNALRKPWRKKNVTLDDQNQSIAFALPQDNAMYEAVMSLPEKYRTALYLFYYEELPVKEISGILRVSATAVTTRLSRGRDQLKKTLAEVCEYE